MGTDAREWFTGHLARLVRTAGSPSLRELAATTSDEAPGPDSVVEVARRAGLAPRPLAHSTIHDLVTGKRASAPDAWTVSMFVVACVCWGAAHGSPVLRDLTPDAVRGLLVLWQQRRADYEDLLSTAAPAATPPPVEGTGGFAADILAAMEPAQAASTVAGLPQPTVARILTAMPPPSAADVLMTLGSNAPNEILDLMTPEAAARVLPFLPNAVQYLRETPHYRSSYILAAMSDDELAALVLDTSEEEAIEVTHLAPRKRMVAFTSSLKDDVVVFRLLNNRWVTKDDSATSDVGSALGPSRLARLLTGYPSLGPTAFGNLPDPEIVAVLDLLPADRAASLLTEAMRNLPQSVPRSAGTDRAQRILGLMSRERACAVWHEMPPRWILETCWCSKYQQSPLARYLDRSKIQ